MRETWVQKNVGTIITLTVLLLGLAAQWANFGQAAERMKAVDQRLYIHETDTERHIDPNRDERRWQELLIRLDRIEKQGQR
jgi:hypothetical protein